MTNTKQAQPGHFYAIGIGPGASDLLTVRAVNIIASADIILSPQAAGSKQSLALTAIEPYLCGQKIKTINYQMKRDSQSTRDRWNRVAQEVLCDCAAGKSVAMITIGDPLIFATTSYLLKGLEAQMDKNKIQVIPGISAFQIAASRFHDALTLQEDRLMLMSATDLDAVEAALSSCETLVLYKSGGVINELLALLKKHQLLGDTQLVSCAEQGAGEQVIEDLSDFTPESMSYMTTMIIHCGRRNWF
ncbi:MAG: precorrin-2 C(20)-methyltransferase [Geopsychrobacter sp.]|nr:precorrin-2 C(20)-methyltransferase [Geopsychrobacter sp.]